MWFNVAHFIIKGGLKPVTDEQVFYDKFICDKFYLLVCIRATLTIFSTTSALVQKLAC